MKNSSAWTTFLLRISMGWLFLYAGFEKLTMAGGFSASGYLLHLSGSFASYFVPLAGNPIVDNLVVYGEILIGIALILGILIRFASFWGIVMMILFYLTAYPPENSLIVDDHFIYVLVLVFLMISSSGHFIGIDKKLEKMWPQFKSLMG